MRKELESLVIEEEPLNQEREEKMKSYNPFKMWGSYFGTLGGLSIHTYIDHSNDFLDLLTVGPHIMNGALYTLGSFLVGWGIHSLFRRFS